MNTPLMTSLLLNCLCVCATVRVQVGWRQSLSWPQWPLRESCVQCPRCCRRWWMIHLLSEYTTTDRAKRLGTPLFRCDIPLSCLTFSVWQTLLLCGYWEKRNSDQTTAQCYHTIHSCEPSSGNVVWSAPTTTKSIYVCVCKTDEEYVRTLCQLLIYTLLIW